ncbi:MAG: hypothetical protein AB1760_00390 [Pseudomonadota bacterium]
MTVWLPPDGRCYGCDGDKHLCTPAVVVRVYSETDGHGHNVRYAEVRKKGERFVQTEEVARIGCCRELKR